jgi:superfamily II DNA/RNA helicase
VLPTGAGKTLVAAVAGYLAQPDLTVIVVPTVSLALDLERRFQHDYELTTPVAYHGGLDAAAKATFRERIASGNQWVVITSPEALLTSLAAPIHSLAQAGRLANFVIDEAHIVAAWGGSFRPAFQAMAGYRRTLATAARTAGRDFRTILLTGTLDTYGMQVLETLFSTDSLTVVSAQVTRPEPSYWSAKCANDEEKRTVLIDAMRHLPRPTIVYTSLVEGAGGVKARDVKQWLKEEGFGRVALVTGSSSRSERESAVRRLRDELGPAGVDDVVDVVVATSAFGLGVDIEGVRTVVHACIPESIDRYYQEVGRGGRDGHASISLVVHSPADEDVARGLAGADEIGVEKAWERWSSMLASRELTTNGIQVSLRALRKANQNPAADFTRKWNLHTLALMELAGMIDVGWSPAAAPSDELTEDQVADHFDREFQSLPIQVLQADLNETNFKDRLEQARGRSNQASRQSLGALFGLLEKKAVCHNQVFSSSFELDMPNGDRAMTTRVCGGCPACRLRGSYFELDRSAPRVPYWASPKKSVPTRLAALFGDSRFISVAEITGLDDPGTRGALVERILAAGAELLVLPIAGSGDLRDRIIRAHTKWFGIESLNEWISRLACPPMVTVVVIPDSAPDQLVLDLLNRRMDGVPIVVIHDSELRVPGSKLFFREAVPSIPISDAMRKC